MADTDKSIPCVPFPEAEVISIPLPFGAEIKSITNLAGGPPTSCDLAHSLMLQLSPMLASMDCLIKLLKAAKAVLDILPTDPTSVTPATPVTIVTDLVEKVVPALQDLVGCFLLFDPCKLARMIAGILAVLLAYINCLIEAFESLWNFKVGLDLDAAQGNPVLLASLNCADANAQASLTSLTQALESIQPFLDLLSPLTDIVGEVAPVEIPTSFETPSLDDLSGDQDPLEGVKVFRDALQTAKDALDAVC